MRNSGSETRWGKETPYGGATGALEWKVKVAPLWLELEEVSTWFEIRPTNHQKNKHHSLGQYEHLSQWELMPHKA